MAPHYNLPISAVVPTYCHADYVLSAVESMWAGASVPREIIVVNDGSTDNTAERREPLVRDNRLRYVFQSNAGLAVARNAGAALATSDYLYFLDDDDLVFPDALPLLVAELGAHRDAAIMAGELVSFSEKAPEPPAMPFRARKIGTCGSDCSSDGRGDGSTSQFLHTGCALSTCPATSRGCTSRAYVSRGSTWDDFRLPSVESCEP